MSNDQQPPLRTGLLEFLRKSVGSQFVIPVYQRNYTWTAKKEVNQYIDDLNNVLTGKFPKHFLGILIYLDTPIDFATREFSVIDGQQRLTTTFLILYVIKNLMIENNQQEQASILDSQFLTNQFVSDKLKFKLKPLVSDDQVYKQIVYGQFDEIIDKNSNVFKNYEWIKLKIIEMLQKYSFNDILLALDKLYVVCIPVVKNDSPQKIFESINSTGSKLLSPDLIRNFILMDIESDTQEKYYKDYWKKLEDYITSDSKKLEIFFRIFLACKSKNLSNKTEVYQEFKIWYSSELLTSKVEDILKVILKYAKYYYIIYIKPIEEVEYAIRSSINEFRSILSDMPAPLLIEIFSLYEEKNEQGERLIRADQFKEIINVINTYLIRRSICGLDTSDITRLFPVLLKDVIEDCNGDYANIVGFVKKNLINKQRSKSAFMPDDDTLRTFLTNANVYNLRLPLRIIFDKIETHNNPAPVNLKKLSVEHLMPQTPTKEWLEELNVDEQTYEKNLHRLGNLTLATKVDNSKMKNKPWDYKKEVLASTGHLTINKEILLTEKWTIEEINKRTSKLIDQILQLYPYTTAPDSVILKHEISIDSDGVTAFGILFEEDGSVEIQSGSELVKYSRSSEFDDWQYEIYNQLLEDGIIKETDKCAVFVKPYIFTSQKKNYTALSVSAGVILCGSRNGWEYWKDGGGRPLNLNKALKERLTNKR
jgi:uncharacterized protein with ParB-like and HNH nuclease domain